MVHRRGAAVLTWVLIALACIDFDHQLLPDSLTLPLMWLGLLLSLAAPVQSIGLPVDPRSSIIGAVAGYLSLWVVYHLFRLLTGKEGMGYGDFKLLAALGAWLGWQMLLLVILLSAFTGAVVGGALILFRGRDHKIPMPYGPYLADGGLDRADVGRHNRQLVSAPCRRIIDAMTDSTHAPPLLIALTGGIASGKSAVAEEFAKLGVPVLDTDQIARDVVAPGTPALGQLVASSGRRFSTRTAGSTARTCASAFSAILRSGEAGGDRAPRDSRRAGAALRCRRRRLPGPRHSAARRDRTPGGV